MNFTLKALVAAAALVAAGSANAAYNASTTGNSDVVLSIYDTSTKDTFYINLASLNSNFTDAGIQTLSGSTTPFTFDLSGTAFSSLISTVGSASGLSWAVTAFDSSVVAGDYSTTGAANVIATSNTAFEATAAGAAKLSNPSTITNSTLKTSVLSHDTVGYATLLTGTTNQAFTIVANKGFLATVGPTLGATTAAGLSIANLVTQNTANVYFLTGNNDAASSQASLLGSFTLNLANAQLTYTAAAVAAVPENDTFAMLLAGLGVMGLVARRRLAA